MNSRRTKISILGTLLVLVTTIIMPGEINAAGPCDTITDAKQKNICLCKEACKGSVTQKGLCKSRCSTGQTTYSGGNVTDNAIDANSTVQTIITTLIWAVGILAVIMIIVGGIFYVTSAGDPGKIKKAKDTIMYGIIGLVIATLAFVIVNFVVNAILPSDTTTP